MGRYRRAATRRDTPLSARPRRAGSRARRGSEHRWEGPAASCRPVARPGRLEVEAVDESAERLEQLLDLGVGVGRGDLDPEPDLVARNERIRGQGHVDSVVEEEAADGVDVAVTGQRDLD